MHVRIEEWLSKPYRGISMSRLPNGQYLVTLQGGVVDCGDWEPGGFGSAATLDEAIAEAFVDRDEKIKPSDNGGLGG